MLDMERDMTRFHEDGQFFDTHYDELLKKYPEHWIAVFCKEVVGNGHRIRQAAERPEIQGISAKQDGD